MDVERLTGAKATYWKTLKGDASMFRRTQDWLGWFCSGAGSVSLRFWMKTWPILTISCLCQDLSLQHLPEVAGHWVYNATPWALVQTCSNWSRHTDLQPKVCAGERADGANGPESHVLWRSLWEVAEGLALTGILLCISISVHHCLGNIFMVFIQ